MTSIRFSFSAWRDSFELHNSTLNSPYRISWRFFVIVAMKSAWFCCGFFRLILRCSLQSFLPFFAVSYLNWHEIVLLSFHSDVCWSVRTLSCTHVRHTGVEEGFGWMHIVTSHHASRPKSAVTLKNRKLLRILQFPFCIYFCDCRILEGLTVAFIQH